MAGVCSGIVIRVTGDGIACVAGQGQSRTVELRGGSAEPLLVESRCPQGAAATAALAGAVWGVYATMVYSCN